MSTRYVLTFAAALGVAAVGCAGSSGRAEAPPAQPEPERKQDDAAAIRGLAAPLVEDDWLVGVTIGWIADGETQVIGLGEVEQGGGRAPDADTVFEIGSITKVFTGLALASMVQEGEVALDTPVSELLPELGVPDAEGQPITLEHLATHTSGLPRVPSNLQPATQGDPYAGYGREELAAFFESFEPSRAPGARYEYSNLGAGLLGEALAARAETSYEELVRERVLGPLGMTETAVRLSEDQAGRLATGYAEGDEVGYWTFDALAGAGALRSTPRDLLALVEANFSDSPESLAAALEEARTARRELPGGDWIALGWHLGLESRGGPPGVFWHNGGTGGFHSFLAFDPEREIGVVVLANSMQPTIEKLGIGVLRRLRDEPAGFDVPRLAEIEREVLRRCEGVYELSEGVNLTVIREDDHLLAQVSGQPQFPIYPSSETEFFYRVVDARIAFQVSEDGEVVGLTLRQEGEAFEARKTRDEPPARLDVVEVEIEDALLERYQGRYELTPDLTLTVERRDGALVAQVSGQPALPIVPISKTEFVYRDVDARVTFVVEGDEVRGLVLQQAGRKLEGEKVE